MRLTKTGISVILVAIVTLGITGFFTIPQIVVGDPEDTGIFTDQYSIVDSFVPFRTAGYPRTTTTTSGQTVEASTDFTGAISILTAQQASQYLQSFPEQCSMKLFTTVVFEDGTRQDFSSGGTFFKPVQTLSLIDPQGRPIKQFEVVPLMTCDTIIAKDGSRIGYINQWLQGVNFNWEFIREDGTKGSFNTASQSAGGTSSAPKCTPVLFDDVGDLKSTGLYSSDEIKRYKETFGSNQVAIFIGSERALCAKDKNGVVAEPFIITASEIENGKGSIKGVGGAGKQFETTLTIRMTGGTVILEVPFLSDLLGKPFIQREAFDQFLSRQVLSFTVDKLAQTKPKTVTPPPSGVDRTIVLDSFSPTQIDSSKLNDEDRTVTMRIRLNSYDISEGVPRMDVQKVNCIGEFCTGIGQSLTATIPMKDAGFSGTSKVFEGKWIASAGQALGTYELKVSMSSRSNDLIKKVEVVQSAENAESTTTTNGTCQRGQQAVSDGKGGEICVAECADKLKWDVIQQACAQTATCADNLTLKKLDDGTSTCVEDPTGGGDICKKGLTFNKNTNKCESTPTPVIPKCKDDEQLVNTANGGKACQKKTDPFKSLTPIVCVDKIGFTDEGLCLPAIVVSLLQNPIQVIMLGGGFIIVLLILKFLYNALNRQRGGIVLSN